MLPPPWVMFASKPAISLSRSSSRMSGRTINMISYVRCIAVLQSFLFVARFAAIELVHCRAGSLRQHHPYRPRSAIQNLIEDRQPRFAHGREHIILAPAPRTLCRFISRGSNPDTNPQPLFAAQRTGGGLNPFIPAQAAAASKAHRAQAGPDPVVNPDKVARRVGIELFH